MSIRLEMKHHKEILQIRAWNCRQTEQKRNEKKENFLLTF